MSSIERICNFFEISGKSNKAHLQRCCDFLTEHQHVNMDCSICLLDLSDSPITVTSCEHFMHSACFCRYLNECARFIRKEIDEADLPVMKEKVDRVGAIFDF